MGASSVKRIRESTYPGCLPHLAAICSTLYFGSSNARSRAYLKLHPKSEAKWDAAVTLSGDQRAAAVQGLFKDTPKGDFAQLVAESIRGTLNFVVPGYLKTAIEALVE